MTTDAAAYQLDDVDLVVVGRGSRAAMMELDGGRRRLQLSFSDQWMSTHHARIERRVGAFWLIDEHSKNGVLVNGSPTREALLIDGDWIEVGHTLLRYRHGVLPPPRRADAPQVASEPALATVMPTLRDQYDNLAAIACSPVSVVLRGETGTGKEMVARAVHRISRRRGDLIAVNCGALPATLLESELFGHRRGAFSNAIEDRPGLVRAADGGTLFLDEIGDLPPSSQAALLRVLQEREVTPLGATHPIKVDLRVICATHRDLEAWVAHGQFRADLYARLAGHCFVLPPLRERREDLGLLAALLLRRAAPGQDVRFEPEAARALYRYHWPLNVRELETVLASALVLARGGAIDLEHLPAAIVANLGDRAAQGELVPRDASTARVAPAAVSAPAAPGDDSAIERQQIREALDRCGGNQSRAAKLLGMSRNTLIARIERYGLTRPLTPRRQLRAD
jgi:transcriptional regulator with GAF, ATPase, and Fis domain